MRHVFLKLIAGAGMLALAAGCEEAPPRRVAADPEPSAKIVTSGKIETEQFRSWAPGDRLVFLTGKVVAADTLFIAGDTVSAAALLDGLGRQAASVDGEALQALGFEPARLDALSAGLELGRPGEEMAPLFEGAQENLSAALAASGAPPKETVTFLMTRSAEAYEQAVRFGEIVDLQAYQTAYGNAVAARDLIAGLEGEDYEKLGLELGILVMMWPAGGPLADRTPPPEFRMAEQFSRVKLALAVIS